MTTAQAKSLADLFAPLFVHPSARGGYWVDTDGGVNLRTVHTPISRSVLVRHFLAKSAVEVVGVHTLSPSTPAEPSHGRYIAIDIDAHKDGSDVGANEQFAKDTFRRLDVLGMSPLLLSTGRGFHLWVMFSKSVSGDVLRSFALWIDSFRPESVSCDVFPRQSHVPEGRFGNWIRLPGLHPKHLTMPAVWNGHVWLTDDESIDRIAAIDYSDPQDIPENLFRSRSKTPAAKRPRLSIPESPRVPFAHQPPPVINADWLSAMTVLPAEGTCFATIPIAGY